MSKPWDRQRDYGRRAKTRSIRDRFLILCEGEKTEPNYFRKFPVQIDLVELDIVGIGANTLSLVQEAIRRKEMAMREGKPYNQVWCVFDRDVFPAANFNDAFRRANANGIRTAYSNQCFELWYFLHFQFNDVALDRNAYGGKLTEQMGRIYKKNDDEMYILLKHRQLVAMRNARKLMTRYAPCNPEKDDPSTTVHLLVEILNEFVAD
jgi:hypothetical protein